jgi:hypothetical protein
VLVLHLALLGFLLPATLQAGASAAEQSEELPVVNSLAVPEYPTAARIAGIEGPVVLDVATDGDKVWVAVRRSGPPMLLTAAEENIKSWRLKHHKPTRFLVTFRYTLDGDPVPFVSSQDPKRNSTVSLRLPADVRVTAPRLVVTNLTKR